MTAREVAWILAHYGRFQYRRQYAVVANVSWGFNLNHEADLLVCSKTGVLTEIEIKCTFSDWKNDAKKRKHHEMPPMIRRFYYAAPLELAQRFEKIWTAEGSGVVGVTDNHYGVKTLREAKTREGAYLTIEQMAELGRLGSMRAWGKM